MTVLSQENSELFGNLDRLPKFGILYDSQKAQSKVSPVIIRFNFILHYYLDKSISKPDHGDSSYNNENMILTKMKFLVV